MAFDQQLADALKEIERLRSALHEYACTGTDHACGCYDQFLSEKTEIERLRAALQSLIDANEGNLSDVDGALYEAHKALKHDLLI